MLKETITFDNYVTGEKVTKDFYFNLNETELSLMELTVPGGYSNLIEQMITTTDVPKLTELFRTIVLASYGEKSPDGLRFVKEDGKLAKQFAETDAYNKLFMKLITQPKELDKFLNGIVPLELVKQMDKPEVQERITEIKSKVEANQSKE